MTNEMKDAILKMAKKLEGSEYGGLTIEEIAWVENSKYNGVNEGLCIRLSNGIAPIYYFPNEVDLSEFMDEINLHSEIEKLIDSVICKSPEYFVQGLHNHNTWRLTAVNYEKAKESGYLDDKAYVKTLDLAYIPTIYFGEGENAKLSELALSAIGVSISEFIQEALKNTGHKVSNLRDVLKHMMFSGDEEDEGMLNEMFPPEDDNIMNVVVDPTGFYGATIIVDDDLLQKTKEEMGDFYIIPSSVNEVIIVPSNVVEPGFLRDLIKDVNTNVVSPEDFLSNNAYYYNGKLQIAA